jgi:hypothetical protein
MPSPLSDQRDDLRPGMSQGQQRREADVLGSDDQRPPGELFSGEVDALLQLPRCHHAGRAVARDQAGGPWSFPAASGEEHRFRCDGLDAGRAGDRSFQPCG